MRLVKFVLERSKVVTEDSWEKRVEGEVLWRIKLKTKEERGIYRKGREKNTQVNKESMKK